MKSLFTILVLIPVLAFATLVAPTGCSTIGPVVDAGKYCAKVAGQAVLGQAIVEVNKVLGCSVADPAAIPLCVAYGLGRLSKQYGKDVVLCVLERIQSSKAAPGDAAGQLRAARAKAVLADPDQVFAE